MSTILTPKRVPARSRAPGWAETPVHSREGTFAAVRWDLAPGESTGPLTHERGEAMLYVIEGRGRLLLDAEELPLDEETVAWLEPGDRYRLAADGAGLAVLAARAEGGIA